MEWSFFGLITADWWLIMFAYIGVLIVPALIGSLWLPDLWEHLRGELEREASEFGADA